MQLHLVELHRIIKKLMDVTFRATDKEQKVLLASLELKTREYKRQLEERLAIRN